VVSKVVEYCAHYQDGMPPEIRKPLKSAYLSDVVEPWDVNFIDLDQITLFELINAASEL
jgi:S-phase kinase-associated protein 1